MITAPWRKTSQPLLPAQHLSSATEGYRLYPAHEVGSGKIERGYAALARHLSEHPVVLMDGYVGVRWEALRSGLSAAFAEMGIQVAWINVQEKMLPENEIEKLIAPFLGGDDPLFGTGFRGELRDFFDIEALRQIRPHPDDDVMIVYGTGALLADVDGYRVYVDVPKNEIQYRSRAGSIANLGATRPESPKARYKRFYFVDWVVCNAHKAQVLPQLDLIVDEQNSDDPAFMAADDLREQLTKFSRSVFRVRPWFEPGPWGGQWLKTHIPDLPQDVPNYAWSFEMIAPEQGLLFVSDGRLLEVSFDWLMYHASDAILGDYARYFGAEFPIRFDFLDTFDGGNLSVQCHPRPDYIKQHFGEHFTQDETYYILDCKPGAQVYLGFQEDIDPAAFRQALIDSATTGGAVDVDRFVNVEPAHNHDLFLIPNGTIHCSGVNIVVLEISATPYIFTFKMYDWQRTDLDGQPRSLNIERAFDNLYFDRRGERIRKEFVSHPRIVAQGDDWRIVHLPTHAAHFYDVQRLEFLAEIEATTDSSVQVLTLVDGESVIVEAGGQEREYHYAETFIIPAAVNHYRIVNRSRKPVKVVRAFLKRDWFEKDSLT